MKNIKPIEKIMDDLSDPNFIHIKKSDIIKYTFNLTHGKGKRKRNKKRSKKNK